MTFYAITSTNPTAGYDIIAIGSTRDEAEQRAIALPRFRGDRTTNLYLDTELKNLVVVSETTARRRYGVGDGEVERFLDSQF